MNSSRPFVLLLAAAIITAALISFNSGAAESAAPQGQGPHQWLERAKEKLGLTDQQMADLQAALDAERETAKALVLKLHDARIALREAIQSSTATESSVRAAAAKVAGVEADLAVERFKLYGKINPVLTSEQRAQVKQFQGKIDDFLDNAIVRLGHRLAAKQ